MQSIEILIVIACAEACLNQKEKAARRQLPALRRFVLAEQKTSITRRFWSSALCDHGRSR
jgi:hypothetical protein